MVGHGSKLARQQTSAQTIEMPASVKTVCIFLKSPRLGEAKSRLARDVGATRASVIYRALVEHKVAEIPIDWRTNVYFAPSNAREEMRIWLAPRLGAMTA